MMREAQIEELFIKKLEELKYSYRRDIRDRNSLEQNFREKFESLNRVRLTENEFERLKTEIITPDIFAASKLLRERNYFQREDESRWYRRYMFFQPVLVITRAGFLFILTMKE